MAQRFCSNCGAALADGAVFCTTCGTPAEGSAPGAHGADDAPQAPPAAPVYVPPPPEQAPPQQSWQPHAPQPQPGFGAHAPAAGTGQKSWMRILQVVVGFIAIVGGGFTLYKAVTGPSATDVDCGDITRQITDLMENQVGGEVEVTNVEEVAGAQAREGQRRCTGIAKASDGSTLKVYMKSYEDGENTMVSYSPTGFD